MLTPTYSILSHYSTLSPTFFPTLAPTLAPGKNEIAHLEVLSSAKLASSLTCHPSPTILPLAGSPDIENVGSLNNPIDVPAGETTTIDALEDDRPARPLPNRLKIEGVTRQARNGRCRVTSNGRELNYTPDDGYDGRDSCQIEVCDSRDVCDKASVFLNVEGEMEPTFSPSLSPTLSPSRFPTELPVSLNLCVFEWCKCVWKKSSNESSSLPLNSRHSRPR